MTDHVSPDVVMIEWIKQVVGIPGTAGTLPKLESWPADGFVTVPGVVGGNPGMYLPERLTVMQVDGFAATKAAGGGTSAGRRAPMRKASQLLERIVLATYPDVVQLTLSADYFPVYIESIYPVSEIRVIPEGNTGYAHLSVDIALNWIERVPVI